MNEAELDALIAELRNEADEAAWHVGYMKVAIDENPLISDRLNDSYSGYAGAIANSAVKAALILYCARAWDKAEDAVCLRRTIAELPDLDGLVKRRGIQLAALGVDFEDASTFTSRHAALLKAFGEAEDSVSHGHIRLLRTEYFAHRVIESKERKKLASSGVAIEPATYDALLQLAEATILLVGEIGYLWDRLSNPYADRIARAEACCREFWHNVPVLRDVEKPLR